MALGLLLTLCLQTPATSASKPWIDWPAGAGPGLNKRVLLVAADDEYRSEEALPMLGELLARQGFACRVVFSIDPASGEIAPEERTNLPGFEAIEEADVLLLFARFRRLDDAHMARLEAYLEAGKPLIGLRTATHAFAYPAKDPSPYRHYSFDHVGPRWTGGFGREVLGTSWVAHHGQHGRESTRGVPAAGASEHPILRGVHDVWGPSDVYAVSPLPTDARVLLEGLVLDGMHPDSPAVAGGPNAPRMPLVWTRERELGAGRTQRVVCSTIGAASDLQCADLRRLCVNAVLWCAGLEDAIPARAEVLPASPYLPSAFGFGTYRRGVRPSDLAPPPRDAQGTSESK